MDAPRLYSRVKALAKAQSADVALRLAAEGVEIVEGRGRLDGRCGAGRRAADRGRLRADRDRRAAPGAARRRAGRERILTWRQLYHLPELSPPLVRSAPG